MLKKQIDTGESGINERTKVVTLSPKVLEELKDER